MFDTCRHISSQCPSEEMISFFKRRHDRVLMTLFSELRKKYKLKTLKRKETFDPNYWKLTDDIMIHFEKPWALNNLHHYVPDLIIEYILLPSKPSGSSSSPISSPSSSPKDSSGDESYRPSVLKRLSLSPRITRSKTREKANNARIETKDLDCPNTVTALKMTNSWTTLKIYDPHDSNLKSYIERLERHMDVDDIVEDGKKLKVLLARMPDSILHFYDVSKSDRDTYDTVKKRLISQFGMSMLSNTAQIKLRSFRLNWKESEFEKSSNEYGALIQVAYPNLDHQQLLDTQITSVLRLIDSNDILFNRLVNKCDYRTYSEVTMDLSSLLIISRQRKDHHRERNHRRDNLSKPITCFYCGLKGHIEPNCRRKQRGDPRTYNSTLHSSSSSSTGRALNQSRANAAKSERIYKSNSITENEVEPEVIKFNGPQTVIPIKINGQEFSALIDTGATIDLVKESVVNRYYNKIKPYTRLVRTALGDIRSTKGQIKLSITLGSCNITSISNVVEDSMIDKYYDIIIGTRSLEKLGKITVCWDKKELTIKDQSIPFIQVDTQDVANELSIAKPDDVIDIKKEFSDLLDVFIKDRDDIGCCTIPVPPQSFTEDQLPPLRRYNFPLSIIEVAKKEINALVKSKVLVPVNEPINLHNLIFVKKEDGSLRPTTDLRPTNRITIKATYPNKSLREMLRIKEAGLFTKLDLTQSFHQFALDPKDTCRFGVYTPWQCYKYLRLPQGFCNSPSICQEIMDRITRETDYATSFLDDIIISTRPDREFHLREKIRNTLKVFRSYGLKLNMSKCVFMSKCITFLGHKITYEGIFPDETNVQTICKIKEPRNIKQLRMYIGAIGFFSMFIPNYSSIMKPLFDLLRKDKPYIWGEDQDRSFNLSKKALLSKKVLSHYDSLKELYIFTDASQLGYSGILCQLVSQHYKPIMYWSKSRPNFKRNFSSCLIELQAGILFMRKIKHYMLGNKTIWFTDSKSLSKILENSDDIKYASYIEELQHYNLEIKHLPGHLNSMADLLSRCDYFQKEVKEFEASSDKVNMISEFNIIEEQSKVISDLKIIPNIVKLHNVYGIYDTKPDGSKKFKVWLPDSLLIKVCKEAHTQGHFSPSKMEMLIKLVWVNDKIKKVCEQIYSECQECLFRNRVHNKITEPRIVAFSQPRVCYSLDICGPFPPNLSSSGYRYILLCVDSFSRFWMGCALKTTKTSEVSTQLLLNIIYKFGRPRYLKSDNASYLNNDMMNQICKASGIILYHGQPYVHTSQSLVERAFLSLENIISKIVQSTNQLTIKCWDKCLSMALHFYNCCPQMTLKLSPYELFFGTEPYLDFDTTIHKYEEKPLDRLNEYQELTWKRRVSYMFAYQTMLEARLKAATKMGKSIINFSIGAGEQILLKVNSPASKFDKLYEGPYTVMESDPYTVKFKKDKNSRKIYHAHLSQIKRYRMEPKDI